MEVIKCLWRARSYARSGEYRGRQIKGGRFRFLRAYHPEAGVEKGTGRLHPHARTHTGTSGLVALGSTYSEGAEEHPRESWADGEIPQVDGARKGPSAGLPSELRPN